MTEPIRFRLAYVPGVMPAKWVRTFEQRRPGVEVDLIACPAAGAAALVRAGGADAVLGRPSADGDDGLALIRLYDEVPVVVVPTDHVLTAADELTVQDLADERYLLPHDDVLGWTGRPGTLIDHRPDTTADAVELVAAGLGVLVVPMSLARLHHRRDLTFRPLTDGPAAPVGLLWREPTGELVEEFIGVVRGRRPGSSRGQSEPAPKRSAKEKAAARRAGLEAAGKVPPRPAKNARRPGARRSPRRSTR
ncbi:LysR substrate-binding domain-containing protein [Gordonia hirsuta]|uniref:LysR substrate-binding domain-containing protein n=1 Tax=Gordonia hirsuta TaxID=53427 RepID=UPI00034A0F01|nr:LysR substrate-binding domain-containing protein [Gordonia hirsuta]